MTINTYLKLLNRHRPGLLDIIPAPQRDEIIFQKPYEFALHQGFSSCSWLLSPDILMKMISSHSLFFCHFQICAYFACKSSRNLTIFFSDDAFFFYAPYFDFYVTLTNSNSFSYILNFQKWNIVISRINYKQNSKIFYIFFVKLLV